MTTMAAGHRVGQRLLGGRLLRTAVLDHKVQGRVVARGGVQGRVEGVREVHVVDDGDKVPLRVLEQDDKVGGRRAKEVGHKLVERADGHVGVVDAHAAHIRAIANLEVERHDPFPTPCPPSSKQNQNTELLPSPLLSFFFFHYPSHTPRSSFFFFFFFVLSSERTKKSTKLDFWD